MVKKTELWYIAQLTLKALKKNNVRCLKRNQPELKRKDKQIEKTLKKLGKNLDK